MDGGDARRRELSEELGGCTDGWPSEYPTVKECESFNQRAARWLRKREGLRRKQGSVNFMKKDDRQND